MADITLMNIFMKPYVIELKLLNETKYNLNTYFYEDEKFIKIFENINNSLDFAIISCFKEILKSGVKIYDIIDFHWHDFDNEFCDSVYIKINKRVCGRFSNAYFHAIFENFKIDLLKYLWIEYCLGNDT